MTVYGNALEGIEGWNDSEGPLGPVEVLGFEFKGDCRRMPRSSGLLLLMLPGSGTVLHGPECGWTSPVRKWILDPNRPTATAESFLRDPADTRPLGAFWNDLMLPPKRMP